MNETVKLLKNRRTIRWFENISVDEKILVEAVDCARLAPSAANLQPLKYKIVSDKERVLKIFPYTKWAGYLPDNNPDECDAPAAFIIVASDTEYKGNCECDAGIALMSITLCLESFGVSSCIIGSFDKEKVLEILNIDKKYKPLYLVAAGYPAQKSVAVEFTGDVKYSMADDKTVSVPKRSLDEVLI